MHHLLFNRLRRARWPKYVIVLPLLAGCMPQSIAQREQPALPAQHASTSESPTPVPVPEQVLSIVSDSIWTNIGHSREGRPIEMMTLGRGTRRLLLIASIHGDEPEGANALEELLASLRKDPVLNRIELRIIRDLNPDGSAQQTRTNANGVDLNRNWPASNFKPSRRRGNAPLSEIETFVGHQAIVEFQPDVIVVFHSTSRGPFVNFDPADGPVVLLAHEFANAAAVRDVRWDVKPSMGYPTPGSLGSFAGIDQRIPILTIEFQRHDNKRRVQDAAISGMRAVLRAMLGGAVNQNNG